MGKIELVKECSLLDQAWIDKFQIKFGHFSEKNFVDNLCNQIFYYYDCLYNVLVFSMQDGTQANQARFVHTSNPLQHLIVHKDDQEYGVYVVREGFFQIPLSVKCWCACGSFKRTNQSHCIEVNFVLTD